MNNLKKLTVAICLVLTLSGASFAGEVNAPPCTPGEVNAPPCLSNPLVTDDPVNPSATISSEVETTMIATAISALEDLLTVY